MNYSAVELAMAMIMGLLLALLVGITIGIYAIHHAITRTPTSITTVYDTDSDSDDAEPKEHVMPVFKTGNGIVLASERECPICLESFDGGEIVALVAADCDHTFHFGCIVAWAVNSNSCPVCRRVVSRVLVSLSQIVSNDSIASSTTSIDHVV